MASQASFASELPLEQEACSKQDLNGSVATARAPSCRAIPTSHRQLSLSHFQSAFADASCCITVFPPCDPSSRSRTLLARRIRKSYCERIKSDGSAESASLLAVQPAGAAVPSCGPSMPIVTELSSHVPDVSRLQTGDNASDEFYQEVKVTLQSFKARREEAGLLTRHGSEFPKAVGSVVQAESQKFGEVLGSVFARFAPRLQQAIAARLGWFSLRPAQELAGDAILSGKNTYPRTDGRQENRSSSLSNSFQSRH